MARQKVRGGSDELTVEVLAYAPTLFFHCQHCEVTLGRMGLGAAIHKEQAASSLPDDLAEEYASLVDQIGRLRSDWGERLRVRIVDAASLEGFLKSLRHRVFRYPTALIDGRPVRLEGRDLLSAVEARLGRRKGVSTSTTST